MLKQISLLLIVTVAGIQCLSSCDTAPFAECGNFLKSIVQSEGNGTFSLSTEEMLNDKCGEMSSSISCIREYIVRCDLPEYRYPPFLLDIGEELCQENSDLRKAYLAEVTCLNRMFNGTLVLCKKIVDEIWEFIRDTEHFSTPKVYDENSECWGFPLIKRCIKKTAKETCGSGAEAFMQEIMSRAYLGLKCHPGQSIIFVEQFVRYRNQKQKNKVE